MNLDKTLLIVTGAHLEAEVHDRPVAYALRERILERLGRTGHGGQGTLGPEGNGGPAAKGGPGDLSANGAAVIVCSDVWYMNSEPLRRRPTVSIGSPAVNAFSAFVGDKLPSVFTVDGVLVVQADLDMIDQVVCCWGRDHAGTRGAVEAFEERYLDQFLRAATAEW